MLNKILLLTNEQINTQYEIIFNKFECSANDTLAVVDNKEELANCIKEGYAVLYVSLGTEFVSGVKYITDSLQDCDDDYFNMVFARQKGIPLTILETKRTTVREITVWDLPALYELYDDEEVVRYVDKLYEYEEEKAFTEKYIENMYGFYGYGLWLVFDKNNGALIGRMGISIRNIDGEEQNELGYIVKREYRNKGYAKEVCEAIIEYAHNNLFMDTLYIVCHDDNTASCRLAKALWFELMGESVGAEENYKIFVKST